MAGVPNDIGLLFAVDPTFPNWKAPVSVNKKLNKITALFDKISLLKKTCCQKCKIFLIKFSLPGFVVALFAAPNENDGVA